MISIHESFPSANVKTIAHFPYLNALIASVSQTLHTNKHTNI